MCSSRYCCNVVFRASRYWWSFVRSAASSSVTCSSLWRLAFGSTGLRPYVLDRVPINDGYPQIFICGILDDAFHFQLFTVQGETHAVAQHNLLPSQIFDGPDTVQAQTASCVRVMEVGKYFWLVHVTSQPDDCLQEYETARPV